MSVKRSSGSTPSLGTDVTDLVTELDDLSDVTIDTETAKEKLTWVQVGTAPPAPTNAVASDDDGVNLAANAYDGSDSTYWDADGGVPDWIYFDLGSSVAITSINARMLDGSNKTSWIKVHGSDNASSWTDLGAKSSPTVGDNALAVSATYRYWKLEAWAMTAGHFHLYQAIFTGAGAPVYGWGNEELVNETVVSADASALPVISLEQADVDEDFFKFTGTSDTNVDRALVDAANFTTPGAVVGWLKIAVVDEQSSSPITDGDYYIPFYSAPTA